MDRAFVEQNQAATERLKKLVARLNEKDFGRKVGEHWTVAIALAHLAFWEQRVQLTLDKTEQAGKLMPVELDTVVNDVMLPVMGIIPGRAAAQLAVEAAEALDKRLAALPESTLEALRAYNPRWVVRALHRNEHLDEVDAALAKK